MMGEENVNVAEVQQKIYEHLTLEEAESYINNNLVTAARVYVANGYFLKRIRDDKLFEDDGYRNFEEYVRERYGKDKGWASKCIKVNHTLSVAGNSPYLDSRYQDYTTYQLVELAYMDEEQRERATPEQTVKQLHEMRRTKEIPYFEMEGQLDFETNFPEVMPEENDYAEPVQPKSDTVTLDVSDFMEIGIDEPEEEEAVATSQQGTEPLSAYGTAKMLYPEESLITTEGCKGGHDCFGCAEECQIRQKDRYCRYAPLGNPFPCTTMHALENIRDKVGNECQFINHELAEFTAGSHEAVPCCMDCKNPCGYICPRAAVKTTQEDKDTQMESESKKIQRFIRTWKELCPSDFETACQAIRFNGNNTEWAKKIQKSLAPYGAHYMGNGEWGFDFHSFSSGMDWKIGTERLHLKYRCLARELFEMYGSCPETDVIEAEFTEVEPEPVKNFDRLILKELIDDTQEALNQMQDYWKENQPRTYTKYVMMLHAYQMLLQVNAEQEGETET